MQAQCGIQREGDGAVVISFFVHCEFVFIRDIAFLLNLPFRYQKTNQISTWQNCCFPSP